MAFCLGMMAIVGGVIWSVFIPMMSDRLNIPIVLSRAVVIGLCINVTGTNTHKKTVWRWGLEYLNIPLVRVNPQAYLGINIIGGAMPVAIALYQLTRVPLLAALPVIGLVTLISYFSVRVVPFVGIFLTGRQIQLLALAAALFSIVITPVIPAKTLPPLGTSLAFSGCVIGSLIGIDLLHVKDLQLKTLSRSLHIGGGGLSDGILQGGLMSLLIAEYFPKLVGQISDRTGVIIHVPTVAIVIGLILIWPILRGCYKSYVWTLSKGRSPENQPLYLGTIAASYARKGRYKKAENLYKQVIALGEPRSVEDCHYKINSLLELAFLYDRQARFQEAELTYQQGISLAKQYAANNALELIALLFNFAQLCERQQRYVEAQRLYTDLLVWIRQFISASRSAYNMDEIIQETQRRLATIRQSKTAPAEQSA